MAAQQARDPSGHLAAFLALSLGQRVDASLQFATLYCLRLEQPFALRAVAQDALIGFALVLAAYDGRPAGQDVPDSAYATAQPGGTLDRFLAPTGLLSVLQTLAFGAVLCGHRSPFASKRRAFVLLRLTAVAGERFQALCHTRRYRLLDLSDAGKRVGIPEAACDLLGLEPDPAGDRKGFAVNIQRDEAASVALRQEIAMLFERMPEAGQIVRPLPGVLKHLFDLARIEAQALRLLPFGQGEVERVFPAVGPVTLGKLPTVFQKQIARQRRQPRLEERQIDRGELLRVDTRPHGMRMPATLLLMNDDGARLAGKPQRGFGTVGGIPQGLDIDLCIGWWVQAE